MVTGSWSLAAVAILAVGALRVGGVAAAADYEWSLPRGFPEPFVPADNPMSDAKVALGRRLFFDSRLSVTGRYSCASCHDPRLAFTDGREVAVGATGERTAHSAMSLANVAYNVSFGWARPEVRALEDQMLEPLLNEHPVELGLRGREDAALASLMSEPAYREAFATVFPEAEGHFDLGHVVKCIAAFERTLISGRSAFDRYVFEGQHDALTPEAKTGMALFYSARLGCGGCHSGFNFSGNWRDAHGEPGEPSFARNGIGPEALRVPTLRNISLTAPYMHDGRLSTLEAVMSHYEDIGSQESELRPFRLTTAERQALIAFLRSLTDTTFTAGFDEQRTHPLSRR